MMPISPPGKTVAVKRASDLLSYPKQRAHDQFSWSMESLYGRLVEYTVSPQSPWLTLLCRLILDAQSRSEPVAWISATDDTFYPPDFHTNGVVLSALPVVTTRDVQQAARAAEHIIRSGAFGLVVLHISDGRLSNAGLGRLASLVDHYDAALVLVTSGRQTLGSLISLRITSTVEPLGGGKFRCRLLVTKDKRNGPRGVYQEECDGQPGMC